MSGITATRSFASTTALTIPEIASLVISFGAIWDRQNGLFSPVWSRLYLPTNIKAFDFSNLDYPSVSAFALVCRCWASEVARISKMYRTLQFETIEQGASAMSEMSDVESIHSLTTIKKHDDEQDFLMSPDQPMLWVDQPNWETEFLPIFLRVVPLMVNLRCLYLGDITVFDRSFKALKNLPYLEILILNLPIFLQSSESAVTDCELLEHIATMSRLKQLSIWGVASRRKMRRTLQAPPQDFRVLELDAFCVGWDWILTCHATNLTSLALIGDKGADVTVICGIFHRASSTLKSLFLAHDVDRVTVKAAARSLPQLEQAIIHNPPTMKAFFLSFISTKLTEVHFGQPEKNGPSLEAVLGFVNDDRRTLLKTLSLCFRETRWKREGEYFRVVRKRCIERGVQVLVMPG